MKKSVDVEGLVKMEVKQVAALPERLEVIDSEMVDRVLPIMAVSLQARPACYHTVIIQDGRITAVGSVPAFGPGQ